MLPRFQLPIRIRKLFSLSALAWSRQPTVDKRLINRIRTRLTELIAQLRASQRTSGQYPPPGSVPRL